METGKIQKPQKTNTMNFNENIISHVSSVSVIQFAPKISISTNQIRASFH